MTLVSPLSLVGNERLFLVAAAVGCLGCLVVMVRAFFMRVTVKSGMLTRYGLLRSKSIPVDAIESVSVEETLVARVGYVRSPVVHYRDSAGERRRLRLWILTRRSPLALEPTMVWLEEVARVEGCDSKASGAIE